MATNTYTFRTRGAAETREALLRAKSLGEPIPRVVMDRTVEDGQTVYVFRLADA